MGSSLIIAVRHATKSYLASSKTAAGSFAIRKASVQDYKYVRELPVYLGGNKAKLITRKFRAMLHDKKRVLLTCELNGMVCAYAALKRTQDVLMMEYFHICGYDQADQLVDILESAVAEMTDGEAVIGVEIGNLSIRAWDIYSERGYQLVGNVLMKQIKLG